LSHRYSSRQKPSDAELARGQVVEYFLGATADREDAGLTIDALDAIGAGVGVLAEHVHGLARDALERACRLHFEHGDIGDGAVALLQPPDALVEIGVRDANAAYGV